MGRDYIEMRCFVAIKPSESVRQKVAVLQEELRQSNADVRWIGPEELHLTLRFFGEQDDATVARLRRDLARIAAETPAFALTFAGLGEFPRVVWVGGSDEAGPLAAAIEKASGLPPDKHGFNPHLTIGRIRSDRAGKVLAAAIQERSRLLIGTSSVTEFQLIQSTLMPQGPVYDVIETYPLRP
jgi:2'-5' RNA ligase